MHVDGVNVAAGLASSSDHVLLEDEDEVPPLGSIFLVVYRLVPDLLHLLQQ